MNPQELTVQTNELRRDWSLLQEVDVDASAVRGRSGVFQKEYHENGTVIPVYVKVYTYRKHPFQRLWRKAVSWTETRNLLFFKSIGIQSPRVIGWGENRNAYGKVIEEFIITEAVPDTEMLASYMTAACPDRSTEEFCARRDSVIDQLGKWTRKIHDHGFFHQDLKWRNILARTTGDKVELFWIDCPKGYFSSFSSRQKHGRLKDCATLDKIARIRCTEEERIRFVAGYLDQDADSAAVETLRKEVSRYRRDRFDAEDERQRANAAKKK